MATTTKPSDQPDAQTSKTPEPPPPVYSFKPATRRKLTSSIEYHQAMADALKDDNAELAATHADVCKQLQALLTNAPVVSAVDVALARQTIRRTVH
jgi:hypothetical protein